MEFFAFFTQLLLLALGVFLMIVILLQRGRGGGLAGAFGGLGGQSAFGTKAGDVFTKITVVIAVLWVLVSGSSGYLLRRVGEGTRAQDLPAQTGMRSAEEDEEGGSEGLPAVDDSDVDTTPSSSETTPDVDGASNSQSESGENSAESSSTGTSTEAEGTESKPAPGSNETLPESNKPE